MEGSYLYRELKPPLVALIDEGHMLKFDVLVRSMSFERKRKMRVTRKSMAVKLYHRL
jgi:hypothetical protein